MAMSMSMAMLVLVRSLLFLSTLMPSAMTLAASEAQDGNDGCRVCLNGLDVPLPEKSISVPGLAFIEDCGQLDQSLPLLFRNSSSSECRTIQQFGSICGCPVASDNSCSLCPSGKSARYREREIAPLADLFLGLTPNCEILEAYLRSVETDDSLCLIGQNFIAEYCGCNEDVDDSSTENAAANVTTQGCNLCPSGEPISLPDKNITIEGFPFQTCGQLDSAAQLLLTHTSDKCGPIQGLLGSYCGCPALENACHICPDGGMMAYPEKPVGFLKDQFGGLTPNCDILAAFTTTLEVGSEACDLIQLGSGLCGCPAIDNHCRICPGEVPPPEYAQKIIPASLLSKLGIGEIGFPVTCELGLSFEFQVEEGSRFCGLARARNDICGCEGGNYEYLGAANTGRKAVLTWVPRCVALLSLIGSMFVISDVARDKKRRKNIYNQLMLCMAFFDVIHSTAWALASFPNPPDDLIPVYGEGGNDAICTFQGFLAQLGLTSIFFNLSLSAYYLVVISFGWRETRIKKVKWMLFTVPTVIGFSLAFGAMPFYGSFVFWCHIPAPPLGDQWWPTYFFFLGPAFFVMAVVTLVMGYICLSVRRIATASKKWRFSFRRNRQDGEVSTPDSSGNTSPTTNGITWEGRRRRQVSKKPSMESEVLWQSLFYLSAFYLTWPIITYAYNNNSIGLEFPFWMTVFTLAPMQGVCNAVIYFRPRWARRARNKKRIARRAEVNSSNTGTNPLYGSSFFLSLSLSLSLSGLFRAMMPRKVPSEDGQENLASNAPEVSGDGSAVAAVGDGYDSPDMLEDEALEPSAVIAFDETFSEIEQDVVDSGAETGDARQATIDEEGEDEGDEQG